jgi:ABC-2 type transport system ATP-binding protein
MESTLEASGLVKAFGKTRALDGLNLTMRPGQVMALLGPNGAGKTTFVNLVATLLRPDAGTLRVDGIDVARHPGAVRRLVALAGQSAAVEPTMTGRENVVMVARLFGASAAGARRDAAQVLEQMGLSDAADRTVRTYSGGMRRRLDLGASLVGRPRLLLLDEPTTGLDPRSRLELWDTIRSLVINGTDVLLTTQYLDEADHLASQIAIIDHGRVVAAGTPRELKQRAGQNVVEVRVRDSSSLDRVASTLMAIGDGPATIDRPTRSVRVALGADTDRVFAALRPLDDTGIAIDEVSVRQPTLDEAFLALTGAPKENVA